MASQAIRSQDPPDLLLEVHPCNSPRRFDRDRFGGHGGRREHAEQEREATVNHQPIMHWAEIPRHESVGCRSSGIPVTLQPKLDRGWSNSSSVVFWPFSASLTPHHFNS